MGRCVSGNNNNERRQAFSDVVAAEAWHLPFDSTNRVVDLHVDVVLGTARLGEEAASLVRFRLGVRRAEVVIVIPELEPVTVDPASVSRDAPQVTGRKVRKGSEATTRSIGAKFGSLFKRGIPKFGLQLDIGGEARASESQDWEAASTLELISVTQSLSNDGHYRWILLPQLTPGLTGRPWDAVKKPLLKLIDGRQIALSAIPPSVRVEVRCRREDLIISDLDLKDESLMAHLSSRSGFKNRLAAAESYIRDQLISGGLEVGDMHELLSRFTLANVVAQPSQSA